MRHKKAGRQFGRNTSHRKAMFRALTANLVANERIETTDAKAKDKALRELSYLLRDNVEVITAPPAPPV